MASHQSIKPDNKELDTLCSELSQLHEYAGFISYRKIERAIAKAYSHTTISKAFKTKEGLPPWELIDLVVEVLASRARNPKLDPESERDRFKRLWDMARAEKFHDTTRSPAIECRTQENQGEWVIFSGASRGAISLYWLLGSYLEASASVNSTSPSKAEIAAMLGYKKPDSLSPTFLQLETIGALEISPTATNGGMIHRNKYKVNFNAPYNHPGPRSMKEWISLKEDYRARNGSDYILFEWLYATKEGLQNHCKVEAKERAESWSRYRTLPAVHLYIPPTLKEYLERR